MENGNKGYNEQDSYDQHHRVKLRTGDHGCPFVPGGYIVQENGHTEQEAYRQTDKPLAEDLFLFAAICFPIEDKVPLLFRQLVFHTCKSKMPTDFYLIWW